MIKCSVILALMAMTAPALAEMTADEFETYTEGKTLFFSLNGQDYGVERYRENRQVEWSFLDGECTPGVWYEQDGFICFAYEGWDVPQCWSFEQTPQGLIARFANASPGSPPASYLAYEKDEEMVCFGPDTGV